MCGGEFCGGLHLPIGSFGQHRSNPTDAGCLESDLEESSGLAELDEMGALMMGSDSK